MTSDEPPELEELLDELELELLEVVLDEDELEELLELLLEEDEELLEELLVLIPPSQTAPVTGGTSAIPPGEVP